MGRSRWWARSGQRAGPDAHPRRPSRPRRRMTAATRLNARLLIGGDHKLVGGQGVLLPDALVEIQDPPGLGRKRRIARKDPAAVEPRPNRVVVQPAPDRAAANGRDQPGPLGFRRQLADAPAGQRALDAGGPLTRERFNGDDDLWGKKLGAAPSVSDPPARRSVADQRATFGPGPASGDHRCRTLPRRRQVGRRCRQTALSR